MSLQNSEKPTANMILSTVWRPDEDGAAWRGGLDAVIGVRLRLPESIESTVRDALLRLLCLQPTYHMHQVRHLLVDAYLVQIGTSVHVRNN